LVIFKPGIELLFVAHVEPFQIIVRPEAVPLAVSVSVGFVPGNVNCAVVLVQFTTVPELPVTVIPPPADEVIEVAVAPVDVNVEQNHW